MQNPIARFAGVPVFLSINLPSSTTEPNFPKSRHRSARVHKKLLKRHGTRPVNPIIKSPRGYFMHPTIWAEVVRRSEDEKEKGNG